MSDIGLIKRAIREPEKVLSVVLHNLLATVGHCHYRRFIVLSRDRTGSNMLVQMLNSHPNIAADYEIFGKLHGKSEQNILDKSFTKQPFYIKAKGFKIFYYHPQDGDPETVWSLLQPMKDLYVVHLKRRNMLRTLVSSRVAYTTGVYGVRSEKEDAEYRKKLKPIIYDAENLREHFQQTRAWEKSGEEMFRNHPMISVDYEDLVSQRDQTFQKVTDFLGVDYRRPKTDFKKQITQKLQDVLENYGQLKTEFIRTEWEWFFDE
jgi:LPS sulfotransferase NodH